MSFFFLQVFISYIDLLNFPQDRQAELQAMYYFLCDCKPCTSTQSLNMILCPNKNCGQGIPVKQQVYDYIQGLAIKFKDWSEKRNKKYKEIKYCFIPIKSNFYQLEYIC
jgi:hypothetical protein